MVHIRFAAKSAVLSVALAGGLAFASAPSAETLEELDTLAELSAEEETGIKLAQEQSKRGELLEAISTLERVLALHPKSQSARFLHAVYLCQIDDQTGGAVELSKLKKKDFPEELWSKAMARCPMAREE